MPRLKSCQLKQMTPMNIAITSHQALITILAPRFALVLIPLALACFPATPVAKAVSPPPDGGYPGGNTAEGQSALFSLSTGGYNTAVGFFSLRDDTTGAFNTAVGAGALFSNPANSNPAVFLKSAPAP